MADSMGSVTVLDERGTLSLRAASMQFHPTARHDVSFETYKPRSSGNLRYYFCIKVYYRY